MTIYSKWGFSENPFATRPLGPNAEGCALLAGRDNELETLEYLVANEPKLILINGSAGVGKTSLANVAAFKLQKETSQGGAHLEKIILPCSEQISVDKNESIPDFKFRVASAILKTLQHYSKDIARLNFYSLDDYKKELEELTRWITDPQYGGMGGGGCWIFSIPHNSG